MTLYKLIDKLPVPCNAQDAEELLLSADKCRVDKTQVGPLYISTTFLVMDHNFSDDGMPILFKTMIFEDHANAYPSDYQERYQTWNEADAGHQRAVEYAKQLVGKADDLLRSETR